MTPHDHERFFHLSASLQHLQAAGLHDAADEVRSELALIRDKVAQAKRLARRRFFAPGLSFRDIEEMAAFGVRFGAIHWIPAVLNLVEHDLPLIRSFESLANKTWATRKTRRFARALRSDPDRVIEDGWTGFIVQIEIAHAAEEYDFTPHWSDVLLMPVYVDRLDQAIRIARVLRDREIQRDGPAPERHLWVAYVRSGRRWALPDT